MAVTSTDQHLHEAAGADFLGHPRGLAFLFTTEMWERFSYYGMRALLVLYMMKYLLQPGHAETVIGLGALKGMLESIFGPLGAQPLSSHIYGFYTGFVYFTPLIGGTRARIMISLRAARSTSELAEAIGMSLASASQQVGVLRDAGLASSKRDGRAVRHALTQQGRSLLEGR